MAGSFALAPTMVEDPIIGKFVRISKFIDSCLTDVSDRFVQLVDLLVVELVTILLRVQLGLVENLIADPVTNAAQSFLVKEERLDRDMPSLHLLSKKICREYVGVDDGIRPVLDQR
jgi:hypothetical protein